MFRGPLSSVVTVTGSLILSILGSTRSSSIPQFSLFSVGSGAYSTLTLSGLAENFCLMGAINRLLFSTLYEFNSFSNFYYSLSPSSYTN